LIYIQKVHLISLEFFSKIKTSRAQGGVRGNRLFPHISTTQVKQTNNLKRHVLVTAFYSKPPYLLSLTTVLTKP
jgi:hypothetical protein